VVQDLNEDADVQRLKQRRQNLMYQVAVLQLQRVRDVRAAAPAQLQHQTFIIVTKRCRKKWPLCFKRGDAAAVRRQGNKCAVASCSSPFLHTSLGAAAQPRLEQPADSSSSTGHKG